MALRERFQRFIIFIILKFQNCFIISPNYQKYFDSSITFITISEKNNYLLSLILLLLQILNKIFK